MTDTVLAQAARMVVKNGLRLGLLTPAERGAALALAWAALPTGACSEREVNASLQDALAGPASFLDTDHVELRRWLVDAGWLQRDGYGRSYQRTPAARVPEGQAPLAAALAARDVRHWVALQRDLAQATRQERHQAWLRAQDAARPGAAAP